MKRVLAITIALLLMLPCFLIPASAEFYSVNSVWSADGWFGLDANTTLCPGRTVMAKTYTKPLYATWGYPTGTGMTDYAQIAFGCVFNTAYNISTMKYVSMELYTTDRSVFNRRFILELTSSGVKDNQENYYAGALTKYVTALHDGWYLVEIPIAELKTAQGGGLNRENCNYMRLYYDDGSGTPFAVGDGFMFGIRDFGFSEERAYRRKEAGFLSVNVWKQEINTWLAEETAGTYWTNEFWGAKNTELCPGETVYAKTLKKQFLASWASGYDKNTQMTPRFTCKYANSYDITDMKYVVWDFYVSDASVLERWFTIDLSSSRSQTDKLCRARAQLAEYATDLGDGWYQIEFPIELLKPLEQKQELDKTQCNSIFIAYDDPTAYVYENGFTFGVRSLGFSKAKAAEIGNTPVAYMDGASVRCQEPTGLRFMAKFDRANKKLSGIGTEHANFGVILISEARYAANLGMTFEELATAGIKVPASVVDESEDGVIGVYAVVSGITEEHFTDNIVAIPYIENELAGAPQKRSIYGVAKCVVADSEALDWHRDFCQTQIISKVEG